MNIREISTEKIWTVSMFLYIVCSTTFLHGDLVILSSVSLYLFLLISLFNIFKTNQGKLKLNYFIDSLIFYAAIMIFGMVYTKTEFGVTVTILYDYITMLILAICLYNYILTTGKIDAVLCAFVVASLSMCLYVYSLYGNDLFYILRTSKIVRIGDRLSNTNEIGWYAAFGTIISIYMLAHKESGFFWKTVCIVEIVLGTILTFLSGSKMALIILASGAIVIFVISSIQAQTIKRSLKYIIIGILAICVLNYLLNNVEAFRSIKERLDVYLGTIGGASVGDSSEIERAHYIKTGLDVFSNHILFGAGTASSTYYLGVYTHNNFVEILMNSGLIGFLLFYFPYIRMLGENIRGLRHQKENHYFIISSALLFAVLLCNWGVVYYYSRYYQLLLVTTSAIVYYFSINRKERGAEDNYEFSRTV